MAKKLPVTKLVSEIRREHEAALASTAEAIGHVLKCGRLLVALKNCCEHGRWIDHVAEAKLSRTTAWRYMRVAQDAAKKNAKFLLTQGASLIDLYREFGLVKPCEGGGYRSEAYQKRKALAQLELDFAFEEFTPHLNALIKSPGVEKLGETTLQRLREDLAAAQVRIDSLLKERNSVALLEDSTSN